MITICTRFLFRRLSLLIKHALVPAKYNPHNMLLNERPTKYKCPKLLKTGHR